MPHAWRRWLALVALACLSQTPAASQAPAQVTLRLVVVASPDEAARIAARARRGESMAALARAHSIDPTATGGGLVGPLDPATLRPELRRALQDLGPGDVTDVIAVATGYAVAQMAADGPARDPAERAANPALAAVGSVKYVLTVAGLSESDLALDKLPKPDGWNRDPREVCKARRQGVALAISALSAAVGTEAERSRLSAGDLLQAHYGLGQLHAYDGRMDAAIAEFEAARRLLGAAAPADATALTLDEALGVAWLHKAALDNGVFRQPGDYCLLTAAGLPALPAPAAANRAVEYLAGVAARRPDDLEVRWLLNLAAMTAGRYPRDVPAGALIPGRAFASAEDVGRFVDVAAAAGLRSFSLAGGVIVDDFDGDGRFDVVTSSFDECAPMRFFTRRPSGGFEEIAASVGLGDQLGGLNIVQADYDNDGCLDILLMRGAWQKPQRKALLRNSCRGTFTDVTAAAGLADPVTATQAAVWTDIDNDGLLDLFVPNEAAPAQLFRNRGDGTFTDIAAAAGVARTAFSKGSTAIDFDDDGWQDLYVSNLDGPNFLYRNNRDRTFSEVAAAVGVPGSGRGFATWTFDYDNDGLQDLFATSYFFSVDETARTYLGLPHNATTLKLYRNLGGRFQDVTREVGLDKVFMPMGANFGDLDNDGFLDVYLGTGNPSYASLVPSVLLRNRAGTAFVDVTASSGTGELHKGHGVAFADLDQDGDEEIVFEVGGAVPGDAHALRLFRNPGHGNGWLDLELTGTRSNRRAIGARIAVTVEQAGVRRTIHRTVSSGGSFGASPLRQHIGLGRADRVVAVDVRWPASGTTQRFTRVPARRLVRIRELADDVVVDEPAPLPLAGASP